FGVHGESDLLTVVTYGNGYYYSRQAAAVLEAEHGVRSKVIDLRWIAPIDRDKLLQEIGACPNVLIVDECRKTGSLSEWLCGAILERRDAKVPNVRVVAADDCFIPLGKAAAAGLPSREEIVAVALDMLKGKGR